MSRPGLLRRLAAICYDGLLLGAVLFAATAVLLPFTGGQAIRPQQPLYNLYLLAVGCVYFVWFWMHGGQTLGMRAWRLRLQCTDCRPLTWLRCWLRVLSAILSWTAFGLGFLWVLFDRQGWSWHDRISRTELVVAVNRPA